MKTKLLLAALALALGINASAATRVFTNTTTSNALWTTAANWNVAVPVAADTVYIVSNSSALLSNANSTITNLYLGYLTATYVGGGALTLSNASLTASTAVYLGLTTLANSTAQNVTLSLTNNSYLYVGSSVLSIGRGYSTTLSNTNYDAYLNVDKTSSVSVGTTLEVGRRFGRGFLNLGGDATSGASVTAAILNMSVENGTGSITMGTNSRLTVATASIGTYSTIVNSGGTLQVTTTAGATAIATNSAITLTGGTLSVGNGLSVTSATINASNSKIGIGGDYAASSAVLSVSGTTVSIGGRFFGVASSSFLNGSYLSASVWESQNASTRTTISGSTFSIGSTSATTWLTSAGTTAHTTISNATIIIGENGKVNFGRTSFSGSVLTMSNGAQLMSGTTFSFLTSTGVIDASTVTVGSTTGAFTVGAGSQLSIANASAVTVTGSATGTTASTISVIGTLNVATASVVNVGSLLDVTGTLNVATTSTFSVGGLMNMTGSASVNLVSSYLSIGSTLSQNSDYNKLNLTNSIMMVNGVIYNDSSAGNVWTNSTVSATGWENRFSSAKTTLSGTVVTLTAAAPTALSGDTSTSFIYLSNGSKIAVGTNSSLLVGRLYVGLSGSASTFESTSGTSTIAARLAIGYTGSSGIATVSNGTIAMRPDNFATELLIGNGGTGSLNVSGTGVITGVETTEVSANGSFSGALYVGTLPGTLPASYVSTQTLSLEGGAAFQGSIDVASDGNVLLTVAGAPQSFAAVTAGTVAFDSAAGMTVDLTGATISGPVDIRLVLADAITGLNFANIVTLGLDSAYTVAYSESTVGDQTALIASISLIPEPAAAALMMGLLGLLAVARRRR